ncbi:MAG: polysaccharide deacetylase family protein [Acidimicrobiales bacterium]|nr:polysaccharide deacetylase family protein [Acidimicrobiales bacterium]
MGALRQATKWASATVDAVLRPDAGITVLIYHRVGRRTSVEVDLPADRFAEQLAWLRAEADVLDLDEAVRRLDAPAPIARGTGRPDRPAVVVTFDDGTADFADVAVPLLVEHGVPATLYVATAFVDEGRPFPDDGTPLSWGALADAASSGVVTVGSHTHTHALLDRLDPGAVGDELDRSIDLIGEHVGTPPTHFAYPKAVAPGAEADAAVRARFVSAALAGTRANAVGRTDLHRLARSPVQVADGMRWFVRKARGGMGAEDRARVLLNRVRYRAATS